MKTNRQSPMLRKPLVATVVMAIVTVLAPGCDGVKAPEVIPVSGKVTYKGRPVPYGQVTLYPLNGPPHPPAALKPDGTFTSKAAAGEYKVVVEAVPPPEGAKPNPLAEGGMDYSQAKPAKSLVPLKYSRPETSDVTVVIAGDSDSQLSIALR